MTQPVDLVHVIFKTHLDVGFTDYAHKVTARYFEEFIPSAIELARKMQQTHPEAPFRWTVGSWLVYEYLERATPDQRAAMVEAINSGYLNWHALPFTTHTELMDVPLFRAGMRLSAELDQRFGRETIAAKMTDVPGHTRSMIPLLAEAGVRFLHIGVNPAATVPDVPPIFVWRDGASGTEVLCMYQTVYGDSMVLPGTNEAVALVFTGDNQGPPTQESVLETYAQLREKFPGARFVGSTLDAVARTLMPVSSSLPVITAEIGDSWVHGVGSDPKKTAQYRELLRLRQSWLDSGRADATSLHDFDRAMIMIPEHTWGMDLKSHLQDYEHYDTVALAEARRTPKFQHFEASWQEQREYIDAALQGLHNDALRAEAEHVLEMIQPRRPDLAQYEVADHPGLNNHGWHLTLDPSTGAVTGLRHVDSGRVLADEAHTLSLLRYETYSAGDYDRYWQQYIRDREHGDVRVWAHPDNVKPGLPVTEHGLWHPTVKQLHRRRDGSGLLVEATFDDAARAIGAPIQVFIEYGLENPDQFTIELQWFDKPACRLPEAFWLMFSPRVANPQEWQLEKLGGWVSPLDVISGGGRTLHATERGARYQEDDLTLWLESLDAPLVAPGQPSLLDFHNRLPDLSQGLHFNLLNNIWGTNFTMWFEDDMRYRFALRLD
jgi:hypothetical protein